MNKSPKIHYDKKSDALWILVKPGPEERVKEIAAGVNVELDKKGNVIGLEILNASNVLGKFFTRRPLSHSFASPQ